jgi:D-aspartate ligase
VKDKRIPAANFQLTTANSQLKTANSRLTTANSQLKKGVIVIEGHVQGLANTRLLGREGIPVIVVDKGNCVARYSKYCKKFFKCPDYLSDDFLDWLIRLHRAENLQDWLLLPSNDHAVFSISKHKDILSKYFKVITEDLDVIDKIYNKRNLLRIAENAGIPIPRTVMPIEKNPDDADLDYPVLIKGNNGLSFYKRWRHKAIPIMSGKELKLLWANKLKGIDPSEYFIQEIIPGENKTLSVTVFAVGGDVRVHWSGVKLREHPLIYGTATCCKSTFENDMLEHSRKLIKAITYTGVCEIEWLRDPRDGKPKLIEINARTWLWVDLAAKCGINYPLMVYDFMNHGDIPNPMDYPEGKYWLNIYTDLFYSCKRLLKGMSRTDDIFSSYRSFQEACWDRRDPKPFFMYGLMTLSFLKGR